MQASASVFRLPFFFILHVILFLRPSLGQTPTVTEAPTAPSTVAQPILRPNRTDVLVPGSTFSIQWTPNPHFSNITLQLWDKSSWGFSRDMLSPCFPWGRNPFCGTIAFHAPNNGSFDWYIPNPTNGTPGSGFPKGDRVFWIKMFVEDYLKPEIGNTDPVVSYGQNFMFVGQGGGEPPPLPSGRTTRPDMAMTTVDGLPGTVFMTVHDSSSADIGATTAQLTTSPSAKQTGAGAAQTPSQGTTLRLKNSMLGILLLMVALL